MFGVQDRVVIDKDEATPCVGVRPWVLSKEAARIDLRPVKSLREEERKTLYSDTQIERLRSVLGEAVISAYAQAPSSRFGPVTRPSRAGCLREILRLLECTNEQVRDRMTGRYRRVVSTRSVRDLT